jgi:voltage-gated sodium channel
MMVGAILEVMSEESNLETATQAHNERHEMAARLEQMQQQLDDMHKLLKSRDSGSS